jgi:hypothetical protein
MRGPRTTLVLAALGLTLAAFGAALPSAPAYVVGAALCTVSLVPALRRRLSLAAGVAVGGAVLGAAVAGPLVALPRTTGLAGEWAAPAIDGEVLGGRAVVSESNAAIDLVTGKTVRLGSVTGGSRWVADDRMLVVREDRVDSVRLDASARWTWRPARPAAIRPLAAGDGSTMLRVCPASGSAGACELVGLDGRGRRAWATDAPGQGAATPAMTGPPGSLPGVAVLQAPGGDGFFLVDPATGRRSLVAGVAALPTGDGPVAVTHASGGRCVTSLYAGLSPQWTSVTTAACPQPLPSRWFAADGHLWVERAQTWERYALDGGARASVPSSEVPDSHQDSRPSRVTQEQIVLRANPFRSADRASALALRDGGSGEEVWRLVTAQPVSLLLAEDGAVVVREDDQVIRYTLQPS